MCELQPIRERSAKLQPHARPRILLINPFAHGFRTHIACSHDPYRFGTVNAWFT
jgi:hypothetical protein